MPLSPLRLFIDLVSPISKCGLFFSGLSVLSEFLVTLSLRGEEDALQTREEERNAGLGKVLRGERGGKVSRAQLKETDEVALSNVDSPT